MENKLLLFRYYDENNWQENTNNAPFPIILLVCPNEKRKKHLYYYIKALLKKSFNDDIEFYLTTKDHIKFDKDGIWQKVQ